MVFGIALGVLVIVLVVLIALMATPSKPRLRVGESPADHGAQAWIEDHDIDEMIEARNDRRRRLGHPEIGEQIGEELQRDLRRRR